VEFCPSPAMESMTYRARIPYFYEWPEAGVGGLSILFLLRLTLFRSRHTIQPQRSSSAWKPPLFFAVS